MTRPHLLSRLVHWMLRFRHRCGYGIHSPFAFGFVTGVVYERGAYYAYARLAAACPQPATPLRRKDLRLLLRLANFQRPAVCLLMGVTADGTEVRYLHAGSIATRFVSIEEGWNNPFDMVYAQGDWADRLPALMPRLAQGGMVVVHGIARNVRSRKAWQALTAQPQCTVSFDLRDFGIIVYRPELQLQHYVVNYF